MARDNYELWFFLEGTNAHHFVTIPKHKTIGHLKEAIQRKAPGICSGIDIMFLQLLKVNITRASDAPGLWAPDGTEEMPPLQLVEQLWPNRPDSGYLHVCVRVPGIVSTGPVSIPCQDLHNLLWGKDIQVLRSVPFGDEGELEYLDAEEIDRLKLFDLEFYGEVLLFRREYTTAYDSLELGSPTEQKKPDVVVLGQPGIGKSVFLFYVLLRRLSNNLPTALQLSNDTFVLFRADGAGLYSGNDRRVDIPKGTVVLTDAGPKFKIPCDVFFWKNWHKLYDADLFVMDYFSAGEMVVLGTLRGIPADDLLRTYNKWGPNARNCLLFSQRPQTEYLHGSRVDTAVKSFIDRFPYFQGDFDALQVSHIIFSVLPEDSSTRVGRQVPVAKVASEYINKLIINATIKAETDQQITFFKSLCTHAWFKSAAGRILESFVLAWLSAHPASTPIPCTAAAAAAPVLKIPVCPKDRAIPLTGLTLLKTTKRRTLPFCFIPISQNFSAIDAIVFDKSHLITVQVTVSPKHDVNSDALRQIWKALPAAIRKSTNGAMSSLRAIAKLQQSYEGSRGRTPRESISATTPLFLRPNYWAAFAGAWMKW
ncbi:hypothetical protein EDB84DRAFT_1568299 [Lactarius hengduanensis]|nr:hypothetical protein EDB84DRAFT_1568299 [Lactarius hengduanensis]